MATRPTKDDVLTGERPVFRFELTAQEALAK